MKLFKRLCFVGMLLLPVGVQAQEMQWEDYEPVSTLVVPENPVSRAKYPFVDVHNHQWRSADRSKASLDSLVMDMDSLNMAVMVNLSGGSGEDLKNGLAHFNSHHPGRVVFFANVDFSKVDEPDFGQKAAAQLEEDVKNGASGLKVFKNLGMYLNDASGARLKTDDPRLDPIWAKCGELGIPVLIHTGDPAPFWKPQDQYNERWFELKERPNRKRPPEPSWEEIMGEQWNVFRKHPNTTFINAHLGWLGHDLAQLGKLMDEMPNMHTEIGAVIAELGRQPRMAREWLIKYQDRVMMGKDSWAPEEYYTYFRTLETADDYFPYYRKRHAFWSIYGLDLPDEVLRKIYYKNALRVIPGIDTSLFPDDYNVEVVAAPGPRPSPLQLAKLTLDNGTYVKIYYSGPIKRGRKIFGELVPYDKLWRTGANEVPEITFTGPLHLEGKMLDAGTYAVYTIPGEHHWTIILNTGLGQHGTANYKAEQDVLRFEVPAVKLDKTYEAFTISLEKTDTGADLWMRWDRAGVKVALQGM